MINVTELPVDVEELRDWANGYKTMAGHSWQKFGDLAGVPGGTLQPFCKGNYAGDNDRIARALFRFRQSEQSRSETLRGIPTDPGYFETPTSNQIRALLSLASAGEITVGGLSPGLGKTRTAQDFLGRVSQAWIMTMEEVTGGVKPMVRQAEKVLGVKCPRNWTASINADIISFLERRRNALLIVDEANELSFEALNQLRAWHDRTGVGICLLGNEELVFQLTSGKGGDALAKLNSRITKRIIQNTPVEGDVLAFCDAWQLQDVGIRKLLMDVAMRPKSGALRECRQIIKNASMIASEDGGRLELAHVRYAVNDREIRVIR